MMNAVDSVVIHLMMRRTSSFNQSIREKGGSALRFAVGMLWWRMNESNLLGREEETVGWGCAAYARIVVG